MSDQRPDTTDPATDVASRFAVKAQEWSGLRQPILLLAADLANSRALIHDLRSRVALLERWTLEGKPPDAPAPVIDTANHDGRFVVRTGPDEGTVLDTKTGYVWQREPGGPMDWHRAADYARDLVLGNRRDWRVPTIEELITLVDFGRSRPASSFPGMPSKWFWSSSSYSGNSSIAWGVYFNNGYVNDSYKSTSSYVRCVRRGP